MYFFTITFLKLSTQKDMATVLTTAHMEDLEEAQALKDLVGQDLMEDQEDQEALEVLAPMAAPMEDLTIHPHTTNSMTL